MEAQARARPADGPRQHARELDMHSLVRNHYEVKVDGQWVAVRKDKIINVVAPDGGAHVCAPHQIEGDEGLIYCVVLPPEG